MNTRLLFSARVVSVSWSTYADIQLIALISRLFFLSSLGKSALTVQFVQVSALRCENFFHFKYNISSHSIKLFIHSHLWPKKEAPVSRLFVKLRISVDSLTRSISLLLGRRAASSSQRFSSLLFSLLSYQFLIFHLLSIKWRRPFFFFFLHSLASCVTTRVCWCGRELKCFSMKFD